MNKVTKNYRHFVSFNICLDTDINDWAENLPLLKQLAFKKLEDLLQAPDENQQPTFEIYDSVELGE